VLDSIDHLVWLMVENRSFDSTVGWLYKDTQPSKFVGADQTPIYQGLQTGSYSNEYDSTVIPVTFGTKGESGHSGVAAQPLRVTGFDPGEKYEDVNQQLFGSPNSPTNSNPPYGTAAGMAGFAYDYDAYYESWEQLNQIMEAYTPEQLPILNGLAAAYGVSDAWYSSVPSQTNPNRAFSLCGTSLGRTDNTFDAVEQFDTKTIWNALPAGVSWGVYYQDIWYDGKCYTEYTFPQIDQASNGEIALMETFYQKAAAGTLPRFSYLEPKWGYGAGYRDGSGFLCGKIAGRIIGTQGNDYHPPTWMGPGEAFLNAVYSALIGNEAAWQRTLLIITFDEHGGTYDHVDPGWGAVTPDQYRGPDGFDFDRYGLRVPTLLISPWVSAGTVFRSPSSTLKLDHTSFIATILGWCGVDPERAGLGNRAAVAPTFEGALTTQPRSDVPTFSVPAGYADQGHDCWITSDDADVAGAAVGRLLASQSTSPDDLKERAASFFDQLA
jgi:phospholipase C